MRACAFERPLVTKMPLKNWFHLGLLLLTTVSSSPASAGKRIPSFAGPYIAYATRFWNCGDKGMYALHLRGSHFNPMKPYEKQRITGNVSMDKPFDDTLWIRCVMDIRSNNQWKENAFVFNFPKGAGACSVLRANIPDFYRVLFKQDPRDRRACRVPPGFYKVANESVSWSFPNFPVMPYGTYRLTMTVGMWDPKTTVVCHAVECHVIPKS